MVKQPKILHHWHEDTYMDEVGEIYTIEKKFTKVKDTGINKNDFNAYAEKSKKEKLKKMMFELLRKW